MEKAYWIFEHCQFYSWSSSFSFFAQNKNCGVGPSKFILSLLMQRLLLQFTYLTKSRKLPAVAFSTNVLQINNQATLK